MHPPSSDDARWFSEELQPHAGALRSYLLVRFPTLMDVDDVVQESLARVLQARREGTPIQAAKSFLFAVARHLALDLVRRQQVLGGFAIMENETLSVLDEAPGVAETIAHRQELELLTAAIQSLPDRCRQVLTLRKIYGLPQREIAAQLGISEHTVEVQVANGMRRCAQYLARRGLP